MKLKSPARIRFYSRIATLVLAGSLTAGAHSWEKLAPLPAPNGGLVCGEVDGKILAIGGTNWETGARKNWLTTVSQFDPATLRWSSLGTLKQPIAYGMGATVGGVFIVVGGSTGQASFAGVIRVKHGKVSSSPTGGIAAPAVISAGGRIGDEIVFAGGTDDAANIKGLGNHAAAWNVRTGALRPLPAYPGPGFGIAAFAVAGDELYVFGGAKWDAQSKTAATNFSDALAFSPRTNVWRRLQPYPFAVRGQAAIALDDRHIYVGGGYANDEFIDRAFIYDVAKDRYTPAPALPYKAGPHLVKSGGFIYCFGGEDRQKHRSDLVYRIKISDLRP